MGSKNDQSKIESSAESAEKQKNNKKYGMFKHSPQNLKINSKVELLKEVDTMSPRESFFSTNNGDLSKSSSIIMTNFSNNTNLTNTNLSLNNVIQNPVSPHQSNTSSSIASTNPSILDTNQSVSSSNIGNISTLSTSGNNLGVIGNLSTSGTTFTMSSSQSAALIPEISSEKLDSKLEEKSTPTKSANTITTTTCANGATISRTNLVKKQRWRRCRERCMCGMLILMTAICVSLFLTLLADKLWKKSPPKEVCQTPACLRAASRLLDKMDRTVSPCENFYQFACGNYLKKNVVPDDFPSRSAMQEMQEDVLVIIKKMLDPGTPTPENMTEFEGDAIGKARRLYHSCMNTSFTVQEKDMEDSPIFDLLTEEQLGEWPILTDEGWTEEKYDLEKLLAMLTVYQVDTFFDSYVTPDEKNSSMYTLQFFKGSPALARNYYLNTTNEEYQGYVSAYRALMKEAVIALAGEMPINSSHIDELIAFEVKFASISDSRACVGDLGSNITNSTDDPIDLTGSQSKEEESSGRMTVAELNEHIPEINWSRMLKVTVQEFKDLNLDVDNMIVTLHCDTYVMELVQLLSNTPKRVIVNYLLWRFLLKYLPYISNYFQQLWQQFRSEVPDPFEERTYLTRWKECATLVNEGFGAALARMYIAKYYDMSVSSEIDNMVEQVRDAFHKVIKRQDWLEDDMKEVCTDKLYLMGKKIGFPEYIQSDHLLDNEFEGLDILEDHFLNNILRMKRHDIWKELQKLLRPVDKKKDWLIQPLIVNAFHNPAANEIILPLGILREPFYNPGYPMYINYGSLGVVVGHELVHGFDNHGKRYDKHGNVSQWWSEQMAEQFMEKATCFIDQYSQYPIEMVGKNVDGNETLGDNICDNAGLLNAWLAYQIWQDKHGVEPELPGVNYTLAQKFFITFGQIWCEVVSKEGYEKYSSDMHSPGVYRTNGVAQNSRFFSETWGCPLGSQMNPEKKCLLWT